MQSVNKRFCYFRVVLLLQSCFATLEMFCYFGIILLLRSCFVTSELFCYFRVVLLLQSCFATYSERGYPTSRRALKPPQDKKDRLLRRKEQERAQHAAETALMKWREGDM